MNTVCLFIIFAVVALSRQDDESAMQYKYRNESTTYSLVSEAVYGGEFVFLLIFNIKIFPDYEKTGSTYIIAMRFSEFNFTSR